MNAAMSTRACLKNHSRDLRAPLCGIFCPNSVAVARYGAFIRTKSPTNCDAHLAESLFQTRSGKMYQILWFCSACSTFLWNFTCAVSSGISVLAQFSAKQVSLIAEMFLETDIGHSKTADQAKVNENAARILDSYGNAILRLAYSYLHNLSDAEDVLQETLIKYLQNAPDFQSPVHEKAWLLRVAANVSKNKIEYNRIRETDELNELLAAEENEDLSFIWAAVKELPEKYREVIHLFYYEGYPLHRLPGFWIEKKAVSARIFAVGENG